MEHTFWRWVLRVILFPILFPILALYFFGVGIVRLVDLVYDIYGLGDR